MRKAAFINGGIGNYINMSCRNNITMLVVLNFIGNASVCGSYSLLRSRCSLHRHLSAQRLPLPIKRGTALNPLLRILRRHIGHIHPLDILYRSSTQHLGGDAVGLSLAQDILHGSLVIACQCGNVHDHVGVGVRGVFVLDVLSHADSGVIGSLVLLSQMHHGIHELLLGGLGTGVAFQSVGELQEGIHEFVPVQVLVVQQVVGLVLVALAAVGNVQQGIVAGVVLQLIPHFQQLIHHLGVVAIQ